MKRTPFSTTASNSAAPVSALAAVGSPWCPLGATTICSCQVVTHIMELPPAKWSTWTSGDSM